MAKNAPFSLSAMVDTDGDESGSDQAAMTARASNKENAPVGAKRKAGRPKADPKGSTKTKRMNTETTAVKKPAPPKAKGGKKKAPLVEVNANSKAPVDEVDDFAQSDTAASAQKRQNQKVGAKRKAIDDQAGRPSKVRATKRVGQNTKARDADCTPLTNSRSNRGQAPEPGESEVEDTVVQEIPETQVATESEAGDLSDEDIAAQAGGKAGTARGKKHGPNAVQRDRSGAASKRPGSSSNSDQGTSEPDLRRKLGEMTRKYDSLSARYRDLRDVGIKEAEANYEQLRKQTEINRKAAADLIASLKKEILAQKAIAQETHQVRAQLQERDEEVTEAKRYAEDISSSLTHLQNENKVLQAKLASSRAVSVANDRTPGSAIRNGAQTQSKTSLASNGDVAIAQLKDDLYSDLTGLILRGVEVGADEDTFDCIQTGRNGTLHFKLTVSKDPEESYDDVEFTYTPKLDDSRDRDLIELLPEYLTEELAFSRMNAAPFYARIMDTLMKRRVVESVD